MHFDEILGKFWLFKTILALRGQISRLLVGRLNSEHNLFLVTDVLSKDKNFLHLTHLRGSFKN